MKTVNSVEIVGFVGRDTEKRSDKAPVKFSVATGGDTKADSGKNPLRFHTVTAWDRQPEVLKIRKGDYVRVVGCLNHNKWTAWTASSAPAWRSLPSKSPFFPRTARLRQGPSRHAWNRLRHRLRRVEPGRS